MIVKIFVIFYVSNKGRETALMTQFSKIFVLFSVVASLLFLGVVSVSRLGGINWEAEARGRTENDPINKYQFPSSGGEFPTYTATNVITDEAAGGSSPILAKKIIDARKDILAKQKPILEQQETLIAKLEADHAKAKKAITTDIEAIKKRQADLEAQLKDVQQKVAKAQELSATDSADALKKQEEATQRRLDVYRLQNELKELRADRFRVEMQLKRVEDALARLKGKTLLLEERNQQLKK